MIKGEIIRAVLGMLSYGAAVIIAVVLVVQEQTKQRKNKNKDQNRGSEPE
jgi:hypothetical protein